MIFSAQLKGLALAMISSFEHGSVEPHYASVEIVDDRGFTAGIAGFTTGTGDALLVIRHYCNLCHQSDHHGFNVLQRSTRTFHQILHRKSVDICSFLPRLQELQDMYKNTGYTEPISNVSGLENYPDAWKSACTDKRFLQAQEAIFNELYFQPSESLSLQLGLMFPISWVVMFDSFVQHGQGGMDHLIAKAGPVDGIDSTDGTDSAKFGSEVPREIVWLRKCFLTSRSELINRDPQNRDTTGRPLGNDRINAFLGLINEGNFMLRGPNGVSWTRSDWWGQSTYTF